MKKAKITKHEIIEQYYIELIKSKKVSPGEQLPTENEIAANFNVSRHTVRQALTYLSQEGWIYKEQGKGSFYSNRDELKAKKNKNVAVITTYISDYIFPIIIKGIERELRKKGYNLLLFSSDNNIQNEEKCLENILNQEIDGLIIEPAQSSINKSYKKYIKNLDEKNIKHLSINKGYDEIDSEYISVNDEEGAYKLTRYLLDIGHKNIAALFKSDDMQGLNRKKGYLKALSEENINVNFNNIGEYETKNQDEYIEEFMHNIINEKDRPTAIVCYNDKICYKVMNYCREKSIRIPDELSLTGFDDSNLATSSEIKMTTIKHPKKEMGIKAAEAIIDMIEGKREGIRYTYPAELIVRESCKKI